MSVVDMLLAGAVVALVCKVTRQIVLLQRVREHRAICSAAYALGEINGMELHAMDGPIPGWPKVTGEFQPWQPARMRAFQNEFSAQVAFARGRHDGWRFAAKEDIIEGAEALLRGEN